MARVAFDELASAMERALLRLGFSAPRAAACARLFAEASLDGVYTHGFERFPRFASYVAAGWVRPEAEPVLELSLGALERWDGRLGPGNLNAAAMTDRAMALARSSGIGCVGLRNTNHWMRGGSYGLRAAEAGCALVAWTNTTPNMPAWGAKSACAGNNPLVVALPRPGGHLVLDMAMSQFSYGKLEAYRDRGEELPVEGGFDAAGLPSKDPAAILASRRPMPVGFWKGSGLSLLLDLAAALVSGGDSVQGIGEREAEYGLSQVFIALDLGRLPDPDGMRARVEAFVDYLQAAEPERQGGRIYYPGERSALTRAQNLEMGIPVEDRTWAEVRALAGD